MKNGALRHTSLPVTLPRRHQASPSNTSGKRRHRRLAQQRQHKGDQRQPVDSED